MQTLLVHNARPRRLLADLGLKNFLAFQVFVGGMVLSLTLHGLYLLAVLLRIAIELVTTGSVDVVTAISLLALLLGYSGAAAISLVGLERIGRKDLRPLLFGLPAYWLLAGVATLCAAVELVRAPFYWAKTRHIGLQAATPAAKSLSLQTSAPLRPEGRRIHPNQQLKR